MKIKVQIESLILFSIFLLFSFGCGAETIELIPQKTFEENIDIVDNGELISKFNISSYYYFEEDLKQYQDEINICNRDFVSYFPGFDMGAKYNDYLASLLLVEVYKYEHYTVYKFEVPYDGPNLLYKEDTWHYYYVYDNNTNKFIYSFPSLYCCYLVEEPKDKVAVGD